MNCILFLSIVVFFTVGITEGDVVFWFHDLTELPEYWTQSQFTFHSTGAFIHVEDFWNPESNSQGPTSGFLLSDYVIMPPGIDSLVIDVQQLVDMGIGGGGAYAFAILNAEINGCVTLELWKRAVGCLRYKNSILTDSLPIHAVINNLIPGDLVQFEFIAQANCTYDFSAECDWWLWDAQLTGYGMLSLVPRTWAGIKSAYF